MPHVGLSLFLLYKPLRDYLSVAYDLIQDDKKGIFLKELNAHKRILHFLNPNGTLLGNKDWYNL